MTPAQKGRYGCEAAAHSKWRMTAPPNNPPVKRPGGPHQPWPIHTHPGRQIHRSHLPPPPPPPPPPAPPPLPSYHLPFFHTRHAEESAERPHLVTVVRPCGLNSLRKVTVLLNRRGVVSFEQLLLDISEALGFPRWHRARVTRLFTTHAREVKGICDFFRGEVAYLALGKARPELSSVQEALEELYPEHSHYRAAALRSWEKRLTSTPDKAAKADSGYSEGADSSDTNQETKPDAKSQVKSHANASHHKDLHQFEKHHADIQKSHKKNSCRKPVCPPNHLQRLNVRVKGQQPSGAGAFRHREDSRESEIPSPMLCENCLSIITTQHVPERMDPLSGRVPLPPVSRRQRGSTEKDELKLDVSLSPQPACTKEKSPSQFPPSKPLPDVRSSLRQTQDDTTCGLPSDDSDVTLSDIERCYEIGRVVGDGNFAVVRECQRRDDGQSLALKIIERSKLVGREHMMQNELSLLGSLRHGRIVRLFAHHHTRTHSYLVMELVSGGDLFEAISERGKFSEAEAGLMVSDMSDALHYIHSKSIVHRDLKPENLLIERVAGNICRLKLGDFGLAMVVTEPVFTICGTPTYVAPEILFETGYGVAVDVWALGVILYILLCGFPPFRSRDRDQEELFQLIKEGQLHFLSPYWDPISEEAKGLVTALLQPDPSVRLTAEQTMQHLWVKTTSTQCWQGAPAVKTQRNTAASRGETEKNLAEANAADSRRARRQGRSSSRGDDKDKILVRPEDRVNESSKQTKGSEDKPLRPQSDVGAVHTVSPTINVNAVSEDTPVQQKPFFTSPHSNSNAPCDPEIQEPGPQQVHVCRQTGSAIKPRVELAEQTEPPYQIRAETKQNSQQQQPSPQQSGPEDPTSDPSTQRPPSNPAPPSPGSTPAEP